MHSVKTFSASPDLYALQVEQLQRISAQQSKIRDMKNKLAAFSEVLARQEAAFAELRPVTR